MWQETEDHSAQRLLQGGVDEGSRGRTILTVLYLVVLALCFIVPIVYYFRMHWADRRARRLRNLRNVETSMSNEEQQQSREEARAARKKYREEKRARLQQLFTPVSLVRRWNCTWIASLSIHLMFCCSLDLGRSTLCHDTFAGRQKPR